MSARMLLAGAFIVARLSAEVRFSGTVLTPTRSPVPGARLVIEPAHGPAIQTFAGVQGDFSAILPAEGSYRVRVEHPGFYRITSEIETGRDGVETRFTLSPVREITETLEVTASPPSIDMDSTSARQGIGEREIMNVPVPNTNDFRSSLRIVPGVVRDSRGGLHIHGATEEQVLYLLNGFNLNDPLSGRFETRFSVESVGSAEVSTGNLPAEFGKGSAGALVVQSRTGDDKIRYSATNFFPGFENRKGWTLSDWAPRLNISGPVRHGRAWISNSFDTQYIKTIVGDLPKGDDRTTSTRFSNLMTAQVNLSPSHILHAGALWNQWNAARTGLTALDRWETTIDRRTRQWFFHVRDQVYLGGGALIEFGYAANRTYAREIPQGPGMLSFTQDGKRGNYFVDAVRRGSRDQVLVSGFLPSFSLAGSHRVKAGVDLDRITYWQNVRRTGFQNFSDTGVLLRRTVYRGKGILKRSNHEVAWFVQDSWRASPGLLIEAGVRADWDDLLRRSSPAPRLGVAWSPFHLRNTKIYAGASSIFDVPGLRVFTRPLDQYPLTSYFHPDGRIGRGPALSRFRIPDSALLRRPNQVAISLGFEHHWREGLVVRTDVMDRRGRRGFTYLNNNESPDDPAPDWAAGYGARVIDGDFLLSNDRADRYRSYSIGVRQTIRRQYQWMVNYTFSRAHSNAVIDINVDDPLTVLNNAGPMPWDAPHRLLSWGYLPLPRKNWAVSFLLDTRNGFPFSTVNQEGGVSGKVNALRFPYFLELNLHLERRFVLRKHRWALRFGANNLTDRINPDSVNNIAGSSRYLRFYGGSGRSTNFRIRWLGRVQ